MIPTSSIIEIAFVLVAIVVGLGIGKLLGRKNSPLPRNLGHLEDDREKLRDINRRLQILQTEGDTMKRRDHHE